MSNSIKGEIIKLSEYKQINEKFGLVNVLLRTDEKYPQDVHLKFTNDRSHQLKMFNVGDRVEIMFNIRSNEYKGKYYTQLIGWRINSLAKSPDNLPSETMQPVELENDPW